MPNKLWDGRKLVEVASNDYDFTSSGGFTYDGQAQLTQLESAEGQSIVANSTSYFFEFLDGQTVKIVLKQRFPSLTSNSLPSSMDISSIMSALQSRHLAAV